MENDYAAGLHLRRQRRKREALIKILLFIFIAITGISIIFNQFTKKDANNSTGTANPLTTNPTADENAPTSNSLLKKIVDSSLKGSRGNYGIAIRNLKTGETYYANEHKVFETASLYKLWVMTVVYKQIQSGQLKEDQTLSEDVTTLNQKFLIASDSAEQVEGVTTFTIHDALKQMITISHNYAALLLTAKIRLASVADFLKENGFNESAVGINNGSPTSTPYDIALFFEKLYKGKFVNQQYTDNIINLLKNQQLNNGIPKYLPDKSKVANKTGELDLLKHDAGIVFTDKGDYVIVIMSQSDSPAGAQEKIALVSKKVFDYFTGKY